ncbi:MAG: toprim domain-containing protein, partial [Thermotogaceae bacterium]|nr:toprim domain-containing protein [Thermotogaceae bacterium]
SIYTLFLEKLKSLYKKELVNNKRALAYLKEKRKLSEKDIIRFEFGYSPPDSKLPILVAKELKLSLETLMKTGVVFRAGKGVRDIFEGRIVIPIKNESGSTIAFGGRILNEGEPKYINSKDTKYFSKSRTLFLLDLAKSHIRKLDMVVVTEGYFDAIALHKAGIENTIAVLGTALTQQHAIRLSNLSKNIILAFDSDEAGKRAAIRSIDVLLSRGFDILVVDYGKYKDADNLYTNEGTKGIEKAFEKAISFEKFIVNYYKERYDLSTPSGVERFASAVGEWGKRIASYSSSVRVEALVKYASDVSGLSQKDLEKFVRAPSVTIHKTKRSFGIDEEIAFLFFNYEDTREEILGLPKDVIGKCLKKILDSYENTKDLNQIMEKLSKECSDWIFSVLKDTPPPSDYQKALRDIKIQLELKKLTKRLKEIDARLNSAADEEKKVLLQARMDIVRKMKSLQRG